MVMLVPPAPRTATAHPQQTTLGATYGMAIAGSVLYFADYGVDKIRAIDVDTNQVSTFSGSGTQGYSLGATTLQDNYHAPMYVAVLGDSLLATENIYHTIRAIEYQLTSSPTSARGDAMVDLSPDLDYNDNTGDLCDLLQRKRRREFRSMQGALHG